MESIIVRETREKKLDKDYIFSILQQSIQHKKDLKRVLIVPPDNTRGYSMGNVITNMFYDMLSSFCHVDILPALGTHMPMTKKEITDFFGDKIPQDRFIEHNWRESTVQIGEVPLSVVNEISGGAFKMPIEVEINSHIVNGSYDLIISPGQVVPHELTGIANYSKNFLVGCGGYNLISKTHVMGPLCNVEYMVGEIDNPVRKVFDYAQEHFLNKLPIMYVMCVNHFFQDSLEMKGLYIGDKREVFEAAAKDCMIHNVVYVEKPVKKVVAFLQEHEFKSTWLGDKAVQRTRTIIEDGGEIVVLAPGVRQFGDDPETDLMMRKYGYDCKEKLKAVLNDPNNDDLRNNLAAACQLMITTPDDRFKITYATRHLSREEVEGVKFGYLNYDDAVKRYNPNTLKEGWNTLDDGEEIYFIHNPELGFWTLNQNKS